MTVLEQLVETTRRLEKSIQRIEKKISAPANEYLSADEVKRKYNKGKKTLQIMRKSGKLENYVFTPSKNGGRDFMYSKNELDKVFRKKLIA